VARVVELGEQARTRVVFGDVVAVHVREDVLDGTRIDQDALRAVGRMAGNTYVNTRARFDIQRPG
jgi:flavin reductase (DIM6/NTAB) family NADH-FMN oxidoreductase RutF